MNVEHKFVNEEGTDVDMQLPIYPTPPAIVTKTVVEYEPLEGTVVFTHTLEWQS